MSKPLLVLPDNSMKLLLLFTHHFLNQGGHNLK